MGEDQGRRVPGFDFSNSATELVGADLSGYDMVQPTSAGTRGVVDARSAARRWCASLVCASATAAAVANSQEAAVTVALGPGHADPRDIELATRVDRFDFAMEAVQTPEGVRLTRS